MDPRPRIEIHKTRAAMGAAAAKRFQFLVAECLRVRKWCRVIFGCAPSQNEFFAALVDEARSTPELWSRVEVFHMDDYVGLAANSPQSFRTYLHASFLDYVRVGAFNAIQGEAPSPQAEAKRYAQLLARAPIDVISMGIGENGHVAFNDPPVAQISDPELVKVVELDDVCRQQQVNDGCFSKVSFVPRSAITITIPVFTCAANLCAIVPGKRKAAAVRDALTLPVGTACPATILRVHARSELYLDKDAASLIGTTGLAR